MLITFKIFAKEGVAELNSTNSPPLDGVAEHTSSFLLSPRHSCARRNLDVGSTGFLLSQE